ncbi:uncharacterized protein tinf2 isoform X2 [Gymnodraco acuticeps]|uniref:Uncharacterized protein tinf2 isoform X2 n=1 Tax=Gymnodraco acuticeps TaxID=8218 RepID=A0A6P8TBM8_GYMAC|nr:uncharacterized protein tinf2 isoform X2 [Gymnodraco acuticeps]
MTERKTKENDATLPLAALQLLAPPVRLVSAAMWKVMEQRDVMHYGVVEEFVTSLCDTVPGLLTVRHQGKLALGLRARLIMELCSTQPDKKEIMSHLERIRAPAAVSTSSATTKKRDLKIMNTVEGFKSLVHLLLTDTTRRTHFFKEEFPVDYGPNFDQELEKLLWEFLIRLDQFLPVPNLAQTVSWLSETSSVLEACARAASQPQLLQTLLQHQTCLGHLETAASLPPNMGDSILTSLSLPPSGKVPSDPPTGATNSFYQSSNTQTRDKTPFIKPVIGLISNEDVPFMIRTQRGEEQAKDATNEHWNGMKRKQPDMTESDSDDEEEEEEVLGMTISGEKRISNKTSERVDDRAALKTCMMQLGVKKLPEDPSLCSLFVSCLRSQPKVTLHKLSVTLASPNRTKSSPVKQQNQRRTSPVKTPTRKLNQTQKPGSKRPGLGDKETQRGEEQAKDATNEHWNPKENFTAIKPKLKDDGTIEGEEQVEEERKESNGMKRKEPDMMESDSDEEEEEEEEEEVLGMTISGKKRISNKTSERVDDRAALKTCMMQLGVKKLPEDPSLCSHFESCLRSQPKVTLHKLSVTPASPNRTKSSPVKQQNQRRTSPVKTPTRKLNQTQKPGSKRPGLGDKENHPVLPGVIGSPSQQRSNSGTSARPGDTEDYVADSEDEATKNFKVRLFTKRYYKTKHGTYVPTLREYWKPGMTQRDLSSVVGKNRR